jgi:hypothetical protein
MNDRCSRSFPSRVQRRFELLEILGIRDALHGPAVGLEPEDDPHPRSIIELSYPRQLEQSEAGQHGLR